MSYIKFTILIFLMNTASCRRSEQDFKTVPDSGVLTCNGTPVAGATVFLDPKAEGNRTEIIPGRSATGTTDESGRFTLSTYQLNDGALIGTHTVRVVAPEETDSKKAKGTRNPSFPCLDREDEVQ